MKLNEIKKFLKYGDIDRVRVLTLNPHTNKPYSREYIQRVLSGKHENLEIRAALESIAGKNKKRVEKISTL